MGESKIGIYHRIMERENFEVAAKDIFMLIQNAQKNMPNKPRALYVDIDGHRNKAGGFDQDMFELQKEFGMTVLLPFVQEMHFPLFSIENPNEQNNNIPEKLQIFHTESQEDDGLEKLYIENYSNTEFIMEPEVYNYLKHFSDLLKEYNEWDIWQRTDGEEQFDKMGLIKMWYGHLREIMNELFNNFIHGNLLSATAMIRTLIECYVYISILLKEQNSGLADEWFLCSIMKKIKKDHDLSDEFVRQIKGYCVVRGFDFKEVYHRYSKKNENSWLSGVINKEKITFRDACEYLNKPEIYKDFQYLCSFVHGQDVYTKMMPFTFYSSIYQKLYLMSEYIFASIRMFEIEKSLEERIWDLEDELIVLGEKYIYESN